MKLGFLDRFARGKGEAAASEGPTVVQIDATSLSRVFSARCGCATSACSRGSSSASHPARRARLARRAHRDDHRAGRRRRDPRDRRRPTRDEDGAPARAACRRAAIVLLGLIAVAALIALLVFGGIYEQSDEIKETASEAADKVEGWVNDAGAGGTSDVKETTRGAVETGKALLQGVVAGIASLASLVFFLTFTASRRSSCSRTGRRDASSSATSGSRGRSPRSPRAT